MSTKWNNSQKLQKTPAVCKASPDPLDPRLRIFRYYPLQAQADWSTPATPLEASISGTTQLVANPHLETHTGSIHGDRTRIDINLTFDPILKQFSLTVSLFIEDIFQDFRFVQFTEPTNDLPFVAGLFTWDDPTTQTVIHCKIFS